MFRIFYSNITKYYNYINEMTDLIIQYYQFKISKLLKIAK